MSAERIADQPEPTKLDLACGHRKRDGFHGVDVRQFDGVDQIVDLSVYPWPWADSSVEEVVVSHYLEHLTALDRVTFMNELHRILKPGAKATIIVPHFASARAYGDPTHQWPPVAEFAAYYWNAAWRKAEAPSIDHLYTCDFDAMFSGVPHPQIALRNIEYQQHATNWFKEALLELHIILTARK